MDSFSCLNQLIAHIAGQTLGLRPALGRPLAVARIRLPFSYNPAISQQDAAVGNHGQFLIVRHQHQGGAFLAVERQE